MCICQVYHLMLYLIDMQMLNGKRKFIRFCYILFG